MGQVALGESKSVRIVVDKIACLRAVCGNGAALLFESLLIKADPVPATDRINFGRGRKRMAPDDILEQPEFACATLNLTCDLIGRLVVAMRIVPPADKKGSRADFPHAINDDANCALGLFAFKRDKAIGEAEEEHLLRFQPELRSRSPRLLLAESRQSVRRIGFAVWMRADAVADNDDLSSQSLSAGVGDQTSAGQALVVGMWRDNDKRPIFQLLTQRAERKRCAASKSSPAVIATDPERLGAARVSMPPRLSARDRGRAGEDRLQGLAICARSGSGAGRPEARLSAGQAA